MPNSIDPRFAPVTLNSKKIRSTSIGQAAPAANAPLALEVYAFYKNTGKQLKKSSGGMAVSADDKAKHAFLLSYFRAAKAEAKANGAGKPFTKADTLDALAALPFNVLQELLDSRNKAINACLKAWSESIQEQAEQDKEHAKLVEKQTAELKLADKRTAELRGDDKRIQAADEAISRQEKVAAQRRGAVVAARTAAANASANQHDVVYSIAPAGIAEVTTIGDAMERIPVSTAGLDQMETSLAVSHVLGQVKPEQGPQPAHPKLTLGTSAKRPSRLTGA